MRVPADKGSRTSEAGRRYPIELVVNGFQRIERVAERHLLVAGPGDLLRGEGAVGDGQQRKGIGEAGEGVGSGGVKSYGGDDTEIPTRGADGYVTVPMTLNASRHDCLFRGDALPTPRRYSK